MVILNSGGGTVTGYGLAAAQLARVKDAKLGILNKMLTNRTHAEHGIPFQ